MGSGVKVIGNGGRGKRQGAEPVNVRKKTSGIQKGQRQVFCLWGETGTAISQEKSQGGEQLMRPGFRK